MKEGGGGAAAMRTAVKSPSAEATLAAFLPPPPEDPVEPPIWRGLISGTDGGEGVALLLPPALRGDVKAGSFAVRALRVAWSSQPLPAYGSGSSKSNPAVPSSP